MKASRYVSTAIVAGLLLSSTSVVGKELKLTTGAPAKTPWGVFAYKIAEEVNKLSSGKMKVSVFPSSQLGNEQVTIRQVVSGRIELGSYSNSGIALAAPEFGLLASPYLWDSYKQADCAADKYLLKIYGPLLEKHGLKLLSWMEVGNMILFSKKTIHRPSDLAGVKLRASPTHMDTLFWKDKGANTIPLGTTEVMPALKTGMVVAGSLPTVFGIAVGFQKIATKVTITNHSYQLGAVVASKKVWDRLSSEEKAWLQTASRRVGFLRTAVRKAEESLIGKIKKGGAEVYRPTAADMVSWKKDIKKTQASIVKSLGGESSEIWKRIQEAKAACST